MSDIRCVCFGSVIAILALTWPLAAAGQSTQSKESWLPLVDVEFSDNGDLIGWQVDMGLVEPVQLIDSQRQLLTMHSYLSDSDVSDQLIWRRLASDPDFLGRFAGSGENFEILRSYRAGESAGSLVHQLDVRTKSNSLRIKLVVLPSLAEHTDGDGSLGDVFYSYSRLYAAPSATEGRFEVVRDQLEGEAAALVVRHVGVVISPHSDGVSGQMTVDSANGIEMDIARFDVNTSYVSVISAAKLSGVDIADTRLQNLLYSDMMSPLRGLARLIEWSLQLLSEVFGNAGLAIIVFAIFVRLMLMPLGLWSIRQQRRFTEIQANMKPVISRIEEAYSGAEKSERILQTYKDFGISPFSGLKGSVSLFVQLPILISLFSVTAESALFRNAPFLWVPDLSLPDHFLPLPFSIPGLGASLNLLPLILGVIATSAAIVLSRSATTGTPSKPTAGLILALIFVVFFYSCAAAIVMYWIVVNVSQIFEGLFVAHSRIRDSGSK